MIIIVTSAKLESFFPKPTGGPQFAYLCIITLELQQQAYLISI
jgi:hypothetical protein